jgi:bacterioferritin (cytochrome b1)
MADKIGLNPLIKSEQEAQVDYKTAIETARKNKDKVAAKVLKHILGEETEHETLLKNLGER